MSVRMEEGGECAWFLQRLDACVDQELETADESRLFEHKGECPACGAAFENAMSLKAALRGLDEGVVMPLSGQAAWRSAIRALSRVEKRRSFDGFVKALVSLSAAFVVLVTGTAYLRDRGSVQTGGSMEPAISAVVEKTVTDNPDPREAAEDLWVSDRVRTDGAADDFVETGGTEGSASDRKILIRRAEREIETGAFYEDEENLRALVSEYDGFFVESSVIGPASSDDGAGRLGNYVVRISSERFSDFLTGLSDIGETVYAKESTEDIQSDYEGAVSGLSSLDTRLAGLDVLKEGATVEEMLAIEGTILEVQGQVDQTKARLSGYESDLDESTIQITLAERSSTGAIAAPGGTLSGRMGAGFDASRGWLSDLLVDIVVALAYAAPVLAVALPLIAVTVVTVRITQKRRRASY